MQANLQTKCLNILPFYFSPSMAEVKGLGREDGNHNIEVF
jgi:hypothetical protein